MAEGPLTREELAVAVARLRPFRAAAAGLVSSSDTLLKALMWQGDLCFGPAREGRGTVQALHHVEPDGPVRFFVEFHRAPDNAPSSPV